MKRIKYRCVRFVTILSQWALHNDCSATFQSSCSLNAKKDQQNQIFWKIGVITIQCNLFARNGTWREKTGRALFISWFGQILWFGWKRTTAQSVQFMRKICHRLAKFWHNQELTSAQLEAKTLIYRMKEGKQRNESSRNNKHHILLYGAWQTMPRHNCLFFAVGSVTKRRFLGRSTVADGVTLGYFYLANCGWFAWCLVRAITVRLVFGLPARTIVFGSGCFIRINWEIGVRHWGSLLFERNIDP